MKKRTVFIILLLALFMPLLSGCTTRNKYYSYEMEYYFPSHYKSTLFASGYSGGLYSFSVYSDNEKAMSVDLQWEMTRYKTNKRLFLDEDDTVKIYSEPYDMAFVFQSSGDAKITFDKITFKTGKNTIDLREKADVAVWGEQYMDIANPEKGTNSFGKRFSEEELADFRQTGIIDLKQLIEDGCMIKHITIIYDNIDVVFKKDRYFTIEYDIVFEKASENSGTERFNFEKKFKRIKFTEKISLLLLLLFM